MCTTMSWCPTNQFQSLDFIEVNVENFLSFFNVANDLDNGHLNKFYELKETNNQQIVFGKLMP